MVEETGVLGENHRPLARILVELSALSSHWLKKYPWLRCSVSTDALYSCRCLLFNTEGVEERGFTLAPVNDWSNVHRLTKRHENLSAHTQNLIASENFVDVKHSKKESVMTLLSTKRKEEVRMNRDILREIIGVLILLARQNIAIRGHTDDRSNFMALLKKVAENNKTPRNHLDNPLAQVNYTSPKIQNELIEICGEMIRDKIVQSCEKASFFALIADEATDSSTTEQVSICVRFLDESQEMIVREELLGFVQASDTTEETLADLFLDTLEHYGITIEDMRAQGYDGAANMSGKNRGVQAHIRERIPTATYVHCKAHLLNLAIVHSSYDACVRLMMATMQEIAFSFHYSAEKLVS
ncbi:zinc finger MYM-type protein 1-like [Ylistrum balloti]|uniref:zinc finger MYM-type protein 1-like n=1 Tax=Ylistrum balloti TaxID=509963 RepID=UPI002905B8CE|nr:zinc finger MYM-type protein 1-like [Ylistrum balloti]